MKPPKWFVKAFALAANGQPIDGIVMTPPMDSVEQALDFNTWLAKPGSGSRLAGEIELKLMEHNSAVRVAHVAFRVVETTLY